MRTIENYWTPSLLFSGGLFDEVFAGFDRLASSRWSDLRTGEIESHDRGWTLGVDLPGVRPQDVTVEVEGEILTVRAEREDKVPEGYKAVQKERISQRFERRWRFKDGVDEGIVANLRDGRLTLEIPKRKELQARVIQVNA